MSENPKHAALLEFAAAQAVEAPGWTLPARADADEWARAKLSPRCIVENYMFADVAALIAPGSTGKTTASLYEAVCIALGRDLWGLQVLNPGPVLFVTAEDRREFLIARLRQICIAMHLSPDETERVRELVLIDDRTADLRRLTLVIQDLVQVADFAHEIVGACKAAGFLPALVQFDPMVSFGVGESRVNDAEQGLIHAARVIVAGLDCCVRFVHHTGVQKAVDKAAHQYAGRGGSAMADGCRMVHVMTALDAAEFQKVTGDRLGMEESAFALHRPKISYSPPQTTPLLVRRRGYHFEPVRALSPVSDEDRTKAIGEQLKRYITAELEAGRRLTRNTLEELRPDNLTVSDVRRGLAWLLARGQVHDAPVINPATGKTPSSGARTYLAAVGEASGNPPPLQEVPAHAH